MNLRADVILELQKIASTKQKTYNEKTACKLVKLLHGSRISSR